MKITNFRDYSLMPPGNLWYARARVDVTTGWWLWRKVRVRWVVCPAGGRWLFLHNGKFAPWCIMGLENAYRMEQRYDRLCETFRTRRRGSNA